MPTAYRSILTPRQTDIAVLLREKRSNKLIAKELGISHFTVRNHITVMLRLLNVETRNRISGQATALGLIEPTNPHAQQD
jgi:two-component system, NarL family, nitrate/nitrite response regulator NarL